MRGLFFGIVDLLQNVIALVVVIAALFVLLNFLVGGEVDNFYVFVNGLRDSLLKRDVIIPSFKVSSDYMIVQLFLATPEVNPDLTGATFSSYPDSKISDLHFLSKDSDEGFFSSELRNCVGKSCMCLVKVDDKGNFFNLLSDRPGCFNFKSEAAPFVYNGYVIGFDSEKYDLDNLRGVFGVRRISLFWFCHDPNVLNTCDSLSDWLKSDCRFEGLKRLNYWSQFFLRTVGRNAEFVKCESIGEPVKESVPTARSIRPFVSCNYVNEYGFPSPAMNPSRFNVFSKNGCPYIHPYEVPDDSFLFVGFDLFDYSDCKIAGCSGKVFHNFVDVNKISFKLGIIPYDDYYITGNKFNVKMFGTFPNGSLFTAENFNVEKDGYTFQFDKYFSSSVPLDDLFIVVSYTGDEKFYAEFLDGSLIVGNSYLFDSDGDFEVVPYFLATYKDGDKVKYAPLFIYNVKNVDLLFNSMRVKYDPESKILYEVFVS